MFLKPKCHAFPIEFGSTDDSQKLGSQAPFSGVDPPGGFGE
jgi:hypothetical protein